MSANRRLAKKSARQSRTQFSPCVNPKQIGRFKITLALSGVLMKNLTGTEFVNEVAEFNELTQLRRMTYSRLFQTPDEAMIPDGFGSLSRVCASNDPVLSYQIVTGR